MENKDPRYGYVRSVWKAGDLASLDMVFRIIPMTVVARDLHLNYERFSKKVQNPGKLSLQDVKNLSNLVEMPMWDLALLVISAMEDASLGKQRKSKA